MWLVNIEAFPNQKEKPDDFKEFGGAIVSCWIDFAIEDGAVELAKFYIKQNGWIPFNITDENVWVNEDDCETTEEKQYFSEAADYGACLIWHKYPFELEEVDEDFESIDSTNTNRKTIKKEH